MQGMNPAGDMGGWFSPVSFNPNSDPRRRYDWAMGNTGRFADQLGTWDRANVGQFQGANPSNIRPVSVNRDAITPNAAPYGSPVEGGRITGHLGEDRGDHLHMGTDIAPATPGERGVAVRAITGGVVEQVGEDGTRGKFVILRHSIVDRNADISRYMHLAEVMVEQGQSVGKGEILGIMGSTGRSTGTHLHLELRKGGRIVDPSGLIAGLTIPKAQDADALAKIQGNINADGTTATQNMTSLNMSAQQAMEIAGKGGVIKQFQDLAALLPEMLSAASAQPQSSSAASPGGGQAATPGNGAQSTAKQRAGIFIGGSQVKKTT